jgi:hypothetical protein
VLTFTPNFSKIGDYQNGEIWKNNVMVRHDLSVSNTSKAYQIRISYLNSTGQLNQLPLQFVWPIKMLDLDLVSYFWIVLIGVITSRALTLFKKQSAEERRAVVQLEIKDYIWIIFSFIIGILIFSSFKNQIDLTSDIIINISLAFGFGFGFEKVLEVGEDFAKP